MSTRMNITFQFNNQLAYDMVTDGVVSPWHGTISGKFISSRAPKTIHAYSDGTAFGMEGRSDAATGVTAALNYWFISAGGKMNSSKSNTKGSLQLYFQVPYTGSNSWSHHLNASFAKMTTSGWSKSADSVSMLLTFNPVA